MIQKPLNALKRALNANNNKDISSNDLDFLCDNFMAGIEKSYSPKASGHTWHYAKDLKGTDLIDTEVWIEGDMLLINKDELWRLVPRLKKEGLL